MRRSVQLREHRLSSNTLCLTIYGKWRDTLTKCNNFIHEAAVCNAHLASAAAEPFCLRSKTPNKGTFLVAVRQAAFYC